MKKFYMLMLMFVTLTSSSQSLTSNWVDYNTEIVIDKKLENIILDSEKKLNIISNKLKTLKNENLAFKVKLNCDIWENVEEITIIISNNKDLKEFKYIRLNDLLSNKTNGEYQEFLLTKSDFIGVNNTESMWYDTEEIIILKVLPKDKKEVKVNFKTIEILPLQNFPFISIDFDDGRNSNYLGKKIMDKYGFKGNAYIISEAIGSDTYMTKKQIDELSADGWDISGHGCCNLKTVNNVEAYIKKELLFLQKNKYKGIEFFAYPNGSYDEKIKTIISKYFKYGRTINPMGINNLEFDKLSIPAYTVINTDKVENIKKLIDGAIKDKKWFHIVFHNLSKTESNIESVYNIYKFEEILKYLKSTNVNVKTNSEVLKILNK